MFVCKHCAGHFEAEAVIDANGNEFCCNGCKNVYAYLKSQGLSEFYSKLKKGEQNLAKPSSKHFDKQSASSMFSKLLRRDENSPFICELEVLISGIHCPACIWLNEKALSNLEGVLELNISATTSKARVLFDERKTALEEILNLIIAIGYDPKPFNAIKSAKNSLSREYYARLIVALACSMNIMWVAIAVYSGYFEGLSLGAKKILHFAEFVLASPPVFYTASVFYRSALSSLKLRQINMDVNVSLGILSVYFYSVYAMLSGSEQVYFDSACMLVTFIFTGKFLQTKATQKAAQELENISSLFVEQVMSVKNLGNSRIPSISEFKPCDVSEVKSGDFVLLRSGERAMIDGVVLSGEASVDNSSINGESVPVGISKDDALLSGALCAEGSVIYKATSSFQGSFLNKLSKLLSNASFARAQIEELANKISSHFGWAILGLCVASFVFWSVANISAWSGANAFGVAISVLVIACPCALSLATPIATLVAMGTATKRSIVFKDAKVLETLAKCDIIAFDKTGTLSKANLKVLKGQRFLPFDDEALLALASASTHPISKAVASYILKNALSPFRLGALENIQNIAGKGITATYKGVKIAGGSAAFIESMAFIESKAFVKSLGASLADDTQGGSEYYFMYDNKLVARFFLDDELREGAKASIKELKKMGLKVLMLSGDKQIVASKVASELGIDKSHGELNPEQKALLIKELQKSANVVMVGDGINDILALKSANVGIAMGSGASVSVGVSDVVLLRDELSDLVFALRLAKKTFKVIKENLFISLVYNALSIPLAMAGFIIPLFAAISMSFSSLLVVLNSLRLKGQL
ncbi:MAG: heavy metal translocating P-type ATPase [Campylobacter sp.]|uniref:heavy metal translocating P-type ATPase n=1 Tax=Campylobacter sp. TaxID=205 RepID=UPI002AA720B8|nr:heavy metal translocating P-type ATPase metal-binding domain-containing protein [Campylobacter sp.]MCI6578665.1 heavy metal translocating P-type ATPase [Campylobacter sp.]